MARLAWHAPGSRRYELGVDRGVLYPYSTDVGVPWNGLVSVEVKHLGGEARPRFIDGVKYTDDRKLTQIEATISALYSPREFDECEGFKSIETGMKVANQPVTSFGLTWRTRLGDELEGADLGYRLHLLYGATVSPAPRMYSTMTDSTDVEALSWNITTVPPNTGAYRRSAYFTIDSTEMSASRLTQIENTLYGTSSTTPQLLAI